MRFILLVFVYIMVVDCAERCRHPQAEDGHQIFEGCLLRTCKAGVWRTSLAGNLCCYERTAYTINTTISSSMSKDGCVKVDVDCVEDIPGQAKMILSMKNSCEEFATQEQIEEIKELLERPREAEVGCKGGDEEGPVSSPLPPLLPGYKLYYEENGAKYYGIPVAEGTTLTEGVVPDTCDAVGMKAVCTGDSSCRYYSARCQVVDLEDFTSSCGNPMWGLAKKLCGGNTMPRNCPEMNGLFNYMKDWAGSECGVVNGTWCVSGKNYTPDNPPYYYAYCVQGYTNQVGKMSDKKKNGMIKEAAANFPLATDGQMVGEA